MSYRQQCYMTCGYRWTATREPLTECPKCYSEIIGPELHEFEPDDVVSDGEGGEFIVESIDHGIIMCLGANGEQRDFYPRQLEMREKQGAA